MTINAEIDRDGNYTSVVLPNTPRPKEYSRGINLMRVGDTVIPWPPDMTAEQALLAWRTNG